MRNFRGSIPRFKHEGSHYFHSLQGNKKLTFTNRDRVYKWLHKFPINFEPRI